MGASVFVMIFAAATIVHIALMHKPRTAHHIIGVILMYFLVVWPGLTGIWGFMGHAFRADEVAAYIGWPAGNPFQFEVAVANLSYGMMGIMCLVFRGNFWIATGVGHAFFAWGAAYGHIRQMMVQHNYAPGNAGEPLIADIAVPIVFFGLLLAHRLTRPAAATRR